MQLDDLSQNQGYCEPSTRRRDSLSSSKGSRNSGFKMFKKTPSTQALIQLEESADISCDNSFYFRSHQRQYSNQNTPTQETPPSALPQETKTNSSNLNFFAHPFQNRNENFFPFQVLRSSNNMDQSVKESADFGGFKKKEFEYLNQYKGKENQQELAALNQNNSSNFSSLLDKMNSRFEEIETKLDKLLLSKEWNEKSQKQTPIENNIANTIEILSGVVSRMENFERRIAKCESFLKEEQAKQKQQINCQIAGIFSSMRELSDKLNNHQTQIAQIIETKQAISKETVVDQILNSQSFYDIKQRLTQIEKQCSLSKDQDFIQNKPHPQISHIPFKSDETSIDKQSKDLEKSILNLQSDQNKQILAIQDITDQLAKLNSRQLSFFQILSQLSKLSGVSQ